MFKSLPARFLLAAAPWLLGCGGGSGNADQALLQGTWDTIRMATAGEDVPPERMAKNTTLTIDGDQMITKRKGKVVATWTYTLDSTKSPKQMTVNTAEPGKKERLSLMIYKIEGDTFTTSVGSRKFPATFSTATEKGCYLTVRRRAGGD